MGITYSEQEEQIARKIAELLAKTRQNRKDEIIELAKKYSADTIRQIKKQTALCKIFEAQLQLLGERDCPKLIIDFLKGIKKDVISWAEEMPFIERKIPFLPVIPFNYLSAYSQILMLRHKRLKGEIVTRGFLNLISNITDVIDTPKHPYYIFDIEDGSEILAGGPEDTARILDKQCRSPLTAAEGLMLAIQHDTLSKHCLCMIGSRIKENYYFYLFLADNNRPHANHENPCYRNDMGVGIPSCATRLIP